MLLAALILAAVVAAWAALDRAWPLLILAISAILITLAEHAIPT